MPQHHTRKTAGDGPAAADPEQLQSLWLEIARSVVHNSHHQYTHDAVYVCVVPWTEFPIVLAYPHQPQSPVPSECGTCKTVTARIWPWLSYAQDSQGQNLTLNVLYVPESDLNCLACSEFAR